jgi:hypothetical protein
MLRFALTSIVLTLVFMGQGTHGHITFNPANGNVNAFVVSYLRVPHGVRYPHVPACPKSDSLKRTFFVFSFPFDQVLTLHLE